MATFLVIGATSAIAKATIRHMMNPQVQFILVARDMDQLSQLSQEITLKTGHTPNTIQADLTQLETIPEWIATCLSNTPHIDYTLIAHGVLPDNPTAIKTIVQSVTVNFTSVALILETLKPHFIQQKGGVIGVITSVAGDRGRQSNYLYGACKGGLSVFLAGYRHALFKHHVSVIDIRPGFVRSPMTSHVDQSGILFTDPKHIATGITKAFIRPKDTLYLPSYWAWIMRIIRWMPSCVFHRLSI